MNIELENYWIKDDTYGYALINKRVVSDEKSKNYGQTVEGLKRFYPNFELIAKTIIHDGVNKSEATDINMLAGELQKLADKVCTGLEATTE